MLTVHCYLDASCVDKISTSKCEKKKMKGKCEKPWVKKNCQLTCDLCELDPQDATTESSINNLNLMFINVFYYVFIHTYMLNKHLITF